MPEAKKKEEMYYGVATKLSNRKTIIKLNQPKDGCDKIVFDLDEQVEIKKLIHDLSISGKPFDFHIGKKLGNGCCTVDEIECLYFHPGFDSERKSGTSKKTDKAPGNNYIVAEVESKSRETVFLLNRSKDGYNKIVFEYNDGAELKGLLLSLFQGGKPFDFKIEEGLGNNCCRIKAVTIPFSG